MSVDNLQDRSVDLPVHVTQILPQLFCGGVNKYLFTLDRVQRKDQRNNSSLVYLVSHAFAEVAGGTWMEDRSAGSR